MSDQITEEYQEQVLDDLSDIKESVTTDSGYQEKVLDDLDDIKESVSEEQEYYDKEYQKKVLGNLRSLQKSVEALNVNYKAIDTYFDVFPWHYAVYDNKYLYSSSGYNNYLYSYLVNDYDVLYLDLKNPSSSTATYNNTKYFFSNIEPSALGGYHQQILPCESLTIVSNILSKESIDNTNHLNYFYVVSGSDPQCTLFYDDQTSDSGGDVTSGSAVMVDGIDTLIQISTFQGFASALLTGILLFLLFVKGLRR